MLEEKAKNEQELNRLQNYLDNRNLEENPDSECERCGLVFNLSNVITKNHLDLGLHREILAFEKMIMEINETEKPLLDELIRKIEDMVKEVYPDSVVGIVDRASNLRFLRHGAMPAMV